MCGGAADLGAAAVAVTVLVQDGLSHEGVVEADAVAAGERQRHELGDARRVECDRQHRGAARQPLGSGQGHERRVNPRRAGEGRDQEAAGGARQRERPGWPETGDARGQARLLRRRQHLGGPAASRVSS